MIHDRNKLPTFNGLIKKDFENFTINPVTWANNWGREMGIFGFNGEGAKDTWEAGHDDDLDAFRHTFMNAVGIAWNPFTQLSEGGEELSRVIVAVLGRLNEVRFSEAALRQTECSNRMDIHNNSVGQQLAPTAETMARWIFIEGVNPNRKIAELVADAVRSGRTINFYDDPRMPEKCRKQSKKRGHFFRWRTRKDEKVRWEHAVKDGQIFNWKAPLPGEDYGCRCWAEPIDEEQK